MHELIEDLKEYHSAKARHLFELEECINRHPDRGALGEYAETVQALFAPFQNTVEVAHHHNEEIILRELRLTSAPIHRRVDEISGDHQAFNRIVTGISAKLNDESTIFAELQLTIRRFVDIYKDHATGEETIFFPIADRYLQDSHWQRIEKDWR